MATILQLGGLPAATTENLGRGANQLGDRRFAIDAFITTAAADQVKTRSTADKASANATWEPDPLNANPPTQRSVYQIRCLARAVNWFWSISPSCC